MVRTSRADKPSRDARPGAQRLPRRTRTTSAESPASERPAKKKATRRGGGHKRAGGAPTSGRRPGQPTVQPASLDTPNTRSPCAHEDATLDGDWADRVRAHRRRQASVSAVLDQTFGRFADSDPSLWDRRAYLMLVGIVYERLATDETEVSTEELIALAKLLAESRRADSQARGPHADTQAKECSVRTAAPNNGRLPDAFGDVVRQVYGTNLPTPDRSHPPTVGATG